MPLVRLVLSFILGILTYLIIQVNFPVLIFVVIYIAIAAIWFLFQRYWLSNYGRRWVFGMMSLTMLYVVAYHTTQNHDHQYAKDHFSNYIEHAGILVVHINEPVAEKTNSFQLVGKVSCFIPLNSIWKDDLDPSEQIVDLQADPRRLLGNIILYLEKDSLAGTLRYGDIIIIENSYEEVRPPQNPRQFNYKRFLANQNIFHSSYKQSGSWNRIDTNKGKSLLSYSLKLREHALTIFSDYNLPEREFAIISALLLGYREYLDEDLRREFAGAGAMHILCVSGLHVGIIYLVLNALLSFLKRLPGGLYILTFLIITLIWLYASITGFSPSVLRATTMFSFVAAGQSFHRRTNIYNTLAASAMLLLIIDPLIITRIGFQLSYLAVVSIVSIQPRLYKQVYVKNKIIDRAWSIITVSIAAQAATGPLSLFYFHQFPNYFIFTNLIVIPLSGFIIYSGLFALLVNTVPFLGYIAGMLMHVLLSALHTTVKHIEGLPYSTSSDLYVGLPETLLMFMFLIFCCMYLIAGRYIYLRVTLAALLVITTFFSYRSMKLYHQKHFVVYHINQATMIDFFIGKERAVFTCKQLKNNDPGMAGFQVSEYQINRGAAKAGLILYSGLPAITTINRPLKHSRVNYYYGMERKQSWSQTMGHLQPTFVHKAEDGKSSVRVKTDNFSPAYHTRSGHYIYFDEKIIVIVSKSHAPINFSGPTTKQYPVDYLIICSNPVIDPGTYLRVFLPSKVIIGSSNSFRNVTRWKEACESMNVEFWVVRERGAYLGEV
jgi:competence protein ComEC